MVRSGLRFPSVMATVVSGSSHSPTILSLSTLRSCSWSVMFCSNSASSVCEVLRPSIQAWITSSRCVLSSVFSICLDRSFMNCLPYSRCSRYQLLNTLSSAWFPDVWNVAIAFFCRELPHPCSLRLGEPRMLVRVPSLWCSM